MSPSKRPRASMCAPEFLAQSRLTDFQTDFTVHSDSAAYSSSFRDLRFMIGLRTIIWNGAVGRRVTRFSPVVTPVDALMGGAVWRTRRSKSGSQFNPNFHCNLHVRYRKECSAAYIKTQLCRPSSDKALLEAVNLPSPDARCHPCSWTQFCPRLLRGPSCGLPRRYQHA